MDAITNAWELKGNLRLEECMAAVSLLKKEFEIPPWPTSQEVAQLVRTSPHPSQTVDVLVLMASLARATQGPQQADDLLAGLETSLHDNAIAGHFRLAYERGMSLFSRGEYSLALNHFSHSAEQSPNALAKLWAKGNVLFCLESLGLPHRQTSKEVEDLIAQLKTDGQNVERAERQILALRMRESFRGGNPVAALSLLDASPITDQASCYGMWLRHLPYHSTCSSETSQSLLEAVSTSRNRCHLHAYHLRTFKGILHPDDYVIPRPIDLADRLYLWVWKWLSAPAEFPISRTLSLLACSLGELASHRMTAEDSQMIRNALLWLALFDPSVEREVDRKCRQVGHPSDGDFLIFGFEYLFIHLFSRKAFFPFFHRKANFHFLFTGRSDHGIARMSP